jgi:hypothetical protein
MPANTSGGNGLFMRIVPSVGIALSPTGSDIAKQTSGTQTNYSYTSGWNTALIAGTAFEFGSRDQSRFILSINYLRSLGNNAQTVTNNDAFKPTATTFSSVTSGFNVSLGVPFNLKKKTIAVPAPVINRPTYSGRCSRYKMYQ